MVQKTKLKIIFKNKLFADIRHLLLPRGNFVFVCFLSIFYINVWICC